MSVQKRKTADGKQTYRVRIYQNRRCIASATFDTKIRAEQWEREQKISLDMGRSVNTKAQHTLLRDVFARYLNEVSVKKKGYRQEASRLKFLMNHSISTKMVGNVRPDDIQDIIDELSTTLAPATVRLYAAVISHVFTIARKRFGFRGLDNPVLDTEKPRVNNERTRRLYEGEEEKLIKACRSYGNPWLAPMVIIAIETAMRRGEILGLRWENIDLKRHIARLLETKNGRSRSVPLSPRAVETLKALPRALSGQVFDTTDNAIKLAFIRVCKKADIQDLRFHDLRHEATSRLADLYPMLELSEITGHRTLQMLKRYYQANPDKLARKMWGKEEAGDNGLVVGHPFTG